MNNPEYILVDVFEAIASAIAAKLVSNINYQYGYIRELDQTINQMQAADESKSLAAYPILWLMQPFVIQRGIAGAFGRVSDLRLFIINKTDPNWKAKDRMTNNYKPILYPIYRELINQLANTPEISYKPVETRDHSFSDIYYWGSSQESVLTNPVDVIEVSNLEIDINNNINCIPQGVLH